MTQMMIVKVEIIYTRSFQASNSSLIFFMGATRLSLIMYMIKHTVLDNKKWSSKKTQSKFHTQGQ
jgi:hypothetical protein